MRDLSVDARNGCKCKSYIYLISNCSRVPTRLSNCKCSFMALLTPKVFFMKTYRIKLLVFALFAALAAPALSIRGAEHRAHLSSDLILHEARHSSGRANVIVPGSRDTVTGLANQHHLTIVKWLTDGAV